jgi:hypothetical protein
VPPPDGCGNGAREALLAIFDGHASARSVDSLLSRLWLAGFVVVPLVED